MILLESGENYLEAILMLQQEKATRGPSMWRSTWASPNPAFPAPSACFAKKDILQ